MIGVDMLCKETDISDVCGTADRGSLCVSVSILQVEPVKAFV